MNENKLSREEAYSPFKSKPFLHDWAREIMDTFPEINEITTENKLRELGVQLLASQFLIPEDERSKFIEEKVIELHETISKSPAKLHKHIIFLFTVSLIKEYDALKGGK